MGRIKAAAARHGRTWFAWLKTQDASKIGDLMDLARWIIPALAIMTAWEMFSDLKSWWGYREEEANILKRPDLKPKCFVSGRREFFRTLVLLVVGMTGYLWLR
ncbi:MAG: hypothetical protein WAM75_14475 [Xanthobacteraceae bacterium]